MSHIVRFLRVLRSALGEAFIMIVLIVLIMFACASGIAGSALMFR